MHDRWRSERQRAADPIEGLLLDQCMVAVALPDPAGGRRVWIMSKLVAQPPPEADALRIR